MSIVSQIQDEMTEVNKQITAERVKGADKRDKRKVQKLQAKYAALQLELSQALAGVTKRKLSSKSKAKDEEPEVEETEEEEDDDEDDDD